MRCREHLYTLYVLGPFGGHQYICQAFLCLSVHPFAPQFITVIPVALHHYGLLLYWTGCLWMSAMLHAIVPFFEVLPWCLMFLQPWLWLLLLRGDCCVLQCIIALNSYHGPLLEGAWGFYNQRNDYYSSGDCCLLQYIIALNSYHGFQQHEVYMMWFCHHHWYQSTLEVLLALPPSNSSNLSLRCLFRLMPIMTWVLHRLVSLSELSLPQFCIFICLVSVLAYAFCFQMPSWMSYSPMGAQPWGFALL